MVLVENFDIRVRLPCRALAVKLLRRAGLSQVEHNKQAFGIIKVYFSWRVHA